MGIGAKLTFAFFTVILVAVLGNAGYGLFLDFQGSHEAAEKRLRTATNKIGADFEAVKVTNHAIAVSVIQDPAVMQALAAKDRGAMAAALKAVVNKTALIGFITIVEANGNVFYSTDTPSKFGYSARKLSGGVDYVMGQKAMYLGTACFSPTNMLTLSSILPILQNKKVGGCVIVSQPLDTEFLTGLVTKFALDADHLTGVDLCLVSGKENKLVAITPNLMNDKSPDMKAFLADLEKRGIAATNQPPAFDPNIAKFLHLPDGGFEKGGRWWNKANMVDAGPTTTKLNPDTLVAILLLSTPVPEFGARLAVVLLLAGTCGAVALLFALLFTAGISKGVNEPLNLLIDRTNELATQQTTPPPLEGLSGDWLELGELIDTALSSMRGSVQSLRTQLIKQQEEGQENSKAVEEKGAQLENLNRQFSHQAKQLTEVSKQINNANRQSVMLQHKLDSVLQVSTEGFLVLDQFGNILSANPVFLNWVGCNEGEIAGRLCFDLIKRPGESPNSAGEGKAFARHGGNPGELINQFYPEGVIYHRHQNKAVEVIAHLQPVLSEDNSIQGYVMVLRDKSLRSEISHLKSEIVAMLSESIRGPLAVAELQWQFILSNAAKTMHPSVGQPLAELHAHYEQLCGVVDSLLMMYGGYVPQMTTPREQIVVTRLVSECLEQVAPLARERQLALDYKSVTGLPNIVGNREAMKDILVQVLEKMISVTSPGGRARVESSARGTDMRIVVSSSGPSLPETEIIDMFAGFVEGKHAEQTYSSRLSMYLARNNLERLGGKIWAESEAGRGTAIIFTLPMQ
ncbi:MAG: PAS domain-containing protein [Candidatus Melainabacteria bacterium]|nr:PAS domain-containing protein [Candidatus Melainabacteria bacterium]